MEVIKMNKCKDCEYFKVKDKSKEFYEFCYPCITKNGINNFKPKKQRDDEK